MAVDSGHQGCLLAALGDLHGWEQSERVLCACGSGSLYQSSPATQCATVAECRRRVDLSYVSC